MAVNENIRKELPKDVLVFDSIAYDNSIIDNSIIGVTTDNRVVYDYDLMVEELINDAGWSYEEAVDWIDYNTIDWTDYNAIRAVPYLGGHAPIIMHSIKKG